MRLVSKVDAEGYFLEDVLLEDGEPIPPATVGTRPPEGFYRPRWTGSAWVEGKPTAEILEDKKAQKIAGFAERAIDDLSPLFTDHRGKDEALHLLVAHVTQIAQSLGVQVDPRLSEVVTIGQKALDRKKQVEVATTEAELEAITWT